MLRITLNGIDLDLPEDIKVDMTMYNPALRENGFTEAFAYSFQVQKTSRNNSLVRRMTSKYGNVVIIFNNHIIQQGIGVVKTYQRHYSIDFKNREVDLRQQLEQIQFTEIEFETIQICNPLDTPTTKIDKWYDHMMQTTSVDSPETGTHKFPWIQPFYNLNQDDEIWNRNLSHTDNALFINSYESGDFTKNIGYSASSYPNPEWRTTISPCIRIQHLLNKVVDKMQLSFEKNELLDVPEFLQMFHYSTLVMDKRVFAIDGGINKQFNVHGDEINLNDFVPRTNTNELFKMLQMLFGIIVSVENGILNIKLSKNQLESKYVDFSKYCSANYESVDSEGRSLKFLYPIDYDLKNSIGDQDYTYYATKTLAVFNTYSANKHATRKIGNTEFSDEIEMNFIPLISIFDYNYITDKRRSRFATPEGFISSYFDIENYTATDKFIIGLIRGLYPLKEGSTFYDRLVFENDHTFDDYEPRTGHEYYFGSCGIYFNGTKNHVDVYTRKYLDFIRIGRSISKTLYLPLHKILDIMTWKEPNHIIKQRNLSFKGTVKEVNFTLYKNSISPTEITYAVVEPEALGDYNDDFNTDFSG